MAHSANRSIDFAPAWLKLPEHTQEQKRQEAQYSSSSSHSSNSQTQRSISQQNNGGRSGSSYTQQHTSSYNPQNQQSSFQQHHSNHHSNSSHHSRALPPSHNAHHHNAPPSHSSHRSSGRPPLNGYNGRLSSTSGAPASSQPQTIHLHRSQSTGSYNENAVRATVANPSASVTSKPLEEEFPVLRSGGAVSTPSTAGSSQPPSANQVSNTAAQWRIKERAKDEASKSSTGNQLNDNLLASSMSGKVYRAQVKPVKRSNMIPVSSTIPISNGTTPSSNITISSKHNGEKVATEDPNPWLSSSLDKEKRFLEELGWKEDAEDDEDCGIPEQDPEQVKEIMMQAKAARELILIKTKQSMKAVPSAVIPREDDLLSSSDDNSETEDD